MGESQPPLKLQTKAENEVQLRHIVNYQAFKEAFTRHNESEVRLLEKFCAARLLIEKGCQQVFINANLHLPLTSDTLQNLPVDVCGTRDSDFILAFCNTTAPITDREKLALLASIHNVKIVLLYPFTADPATIQHHIPNKYADKIMIEQIPWIDDEIEDAFQEAIELINLLTNQTRVKMLIPLLKQTRSKGEYRLRINPKLVYENLNNLLERNLLHELSRNEYTLTPIGKQILGEYLTFIQRIKNTLRTNKR
jgi:hypothetical protein